MTAASVLRSRARRLIEAANELLLIAHDLDNMAKPSGIEDDTATPGGQDHAHDDHPAMIDHARRAYADRRLRERIFDCPALFGEPAWDILLDLFVAQKARKSISVTSACIGSQVPSTTALRWIAVLEQYGLVIREDDPKDKRRAILRLTSDAYAKMTNYFSQSVSSSMLPPRMIADHS